METVEALKSIWELVSNAHPSGHSASAANTSDSIESGLAPCYNMPYGATGMFIHLAFAWAILMLYLRRTPFVPWAGLSRPTIAVALCTFSFVAVCIAPVVSNGLRKCAEQHI